MQLRREFYDFLLKWRENKRRECLLVKGARQIGKTYIIEQFGREQYESCVLINFIDHPEYKAKTCATASLDKLLKPTEIPYGYKFAGGNVGVSGKKITLPHYMAMFVEPAT